MADSEVLISDSGGIRTITLNRPEVLNALTDTMRASIARAVTEFDEDDGLHVLVLTGAGRGFCSGADLSAGTPSTEAPKRPAPRFFWHLPFERTNKPTICAVNGAAAGGGLGLVLSCDIVVAANTAKLHPAFVGLGLSPDNGVSQKLVARIGYPRALQFFLSGTPLTADEAKEIGFVDHVVPADELEARTRDLAAKFAAQAPVAVMLTKGLLKEAHKHDRATGLILEEAAIALARQTADSTEGLAAFRERRPPQWKGY